MSQLVPAVAPDFHPTNTRRMRRALAAVIRGAVSKDTVSWEAWNARSLANDPIERRIMRAAVIDIGKPGQNLGWAIDGHPDQQSQKGTHVRVARVNLGTIDAGQARRISRTTTVNP
jgi:hypothetical protein